MGTEAFTPWNIPSPTQMHKEIGRCLGKTKMPGGLRSALSGGHEIAYHTFYLFKGFQCNSAEHFFSPNNLGKHDFQTTMVGAVQVFQGPSSRELQLRIQLQPVSRGLAQPLGKEQWKRECD